MVTPARPLPSAANGTPPTAAAGYRVPTAARHLPPTVLRPGPEEGRMPERGGYCSAAAPVVRGRRRQAAGRASPEATDAGRGQRSRTGRSAERTTLRRLGRRTVLQTTRRASSASGQPSERRQRKRRGGAAARGGDQGRCEVYDRLAQGVGGGGKPETSDQASHQGREGGNRGGARRRQRRVKEKRRSALRVTAQIDDV